MRKHATNIITDGKKDFLQPLITQNPEQQRRIALVIGNANYSQGQLNNPVNDANDITEVLREVGFEVILLTNADLKEMEESLEKLSSQLKRGGVGLFYYAGHGVQVDGENYLIPIGSQLNRSQDARYLAFPVGRVLGAMEDAGNGANIVILDACRDNPFPQQWRSNQRGLAAVQSTTGTLIAYATRPGGLSKDGDGRNGTYTSHLLKHIRDPNLDVELMFKKVREGVFQETNGLQIPWESSSLIGSFVFNSEVSEVQPIIEKPVSEVSEAQPTIDKPVSLEAEVRTYTPNSVSNSEQLETINNNSITHNPNFQYNLALNIEGHSDLVRSLAISSNGQHIVSGSEDDTIKVWNLKTGNLENTLEGHSDDVRSLVISSDGQRIISGGGDHTIKVWNLKTGDLENTLEGHSGSVRSVAISNDGQRIVSGSGDHTIKVWNLKT
ncbi:caspase family protein, partial [Xenococcus sp. PCC 7305]|uniref:caspase family protein n=1 Tax=Xenococcus sp. PCC 7305 TaxID=102125 RepID=UPI00187D75F9